MDVCHLSYITKLAGKQKTQKKKTNNNKNKNKKQKTKDIVYWSPIILKIYGIFKRQASSSTLGNFDKYFLCTQISNKISLFV
jgi:hypothetical protein